MGVFRNLTDAILIFFFAVIAIFVPLLIPQICFPNNYYPKVLVGFKSWFSRQFGYYLIEEKPSFFVGLVWLELLFQWPLSLLNLYAILGGKSWLRTTCLASGVCVLTSMVAIFSEMVGSQRLSNKLYMLYGPLMGFLVVAILRGLLPYSGKATVAGRKTRID